MKTYHEKAAEIKKSWVIFDADGKTLGRLSSEIARVLRGKHKPSFAPHLDCGDHVVVVNSDKIKLTGSKLKNKNYYRYSGFVGGLKTTTAAKMLESHSDRIVEAAVKGMLPKNKLASRILKHLKVYKGAEHPHEAQSPVIHPGRTAGISARD